MPGRGGRGGGGGSRASLPREVMISKKISYVLRHGAEKEGLKLDENGYINCAELLMWQQLRSTHVTFDELQDIVANNDKKRFQMIPTSETILASSTTPSDYLIRASQGHSIAIASDNILTPITLNDPDCPAEVVHGTFPATWPKILASGGLKRMSRTHIHFATGLPSDSASKTRSNKPVATKSKFAAQSTVKSSLSSFSGVETGHDLPEEASEASGSISTSLESHSTVTEDAPAVISGMRSDASILVWVNIRRSLESGLRWWRSANGVILTEGDEDGMVKLEYISRVEKRGAGFVIWNPSEKS